MLPEGAFEPGRVGRERESRDDALPTNMFPTLSGASLELHVLSGKSFETFGN